MAERPPKSRNGGLNAYWSERRLKRRRLTQPCCTLKDERRYSKLWSFSTPTYQRQANRGENQTNSMRRLGEGMRVAGVIKHEQMYATEHEQQYKRKHGYAEKEAPSSAATPWRHDRYRLGRSFDLQATYPSSRQRMSA